LSILTNPVVIGYGKQILSGVVGGALGKVFGDEGPNVAKKLSQEVGCNILQVNASQARALMAKGINPCTNEPYMGGDIVAGSQPYDPGYYPTGYQIPQETRDVLSTPALPAPTGGGGLMAGASGGTGYLEYTTTGKVRSVVKNGRRVATRRKAAAFIRKYGFEISASAFGLSMQQLAKIVLDDQMTPRRRRGLSYKQIQQAKRVIRTVKSMSSALGSCTTRRSPARRKTSCR